MLCPDLATAVTKRRRPSCATFPPAVWERLVERARATEVPVVVRERVRQRPGVLASAVAGLRGRRPRLVEWKGPHRPPGDDVIPADLRIDHVYLVSCKYLSRVLLNPSPARLFERLLVGEERSIDNWFARTAPHEFQAFYAAARPRGSPTFPPTSWRSTRPQQRQLKARAGRPQTAGRSARRRGRHCASPSRSRSAATWEAAMAVAARSAATAVAAVAHHDRDLFRAGYRRERAPPTADRLGVGLDAGLRTALARGRGAPRRTARGGVAGRRATAGVAVRPRGERARRDPLEPRPFRGIHPRRRCTSILRTPRSPASTCFPSGLVASLCPCFDRHVADAEVGVVAINRRLVS